jgi:acetoin utilization deacetylase AcuC-like enzyme
MTLILSDDSAGRHQTPAGHPERPERYQAVTAAVAGSGLRVENAPLASRDQLALVHSERYLDMIFDTLEEQDFSDNRLVQLDADTYAGPDSLEAALRGAGAACLGVDKVMSGAEQSVFSAMRPPGHHAEPERAMGFCLFSNAAIAAFHAARKWQARRVAVLDFDVHHGNGTQAAFWHEADFFYASSHQMPLYPGTGAADERGAYNNILNLPLHEGTGGAAFLRGWREILLPFIAEAECDLIILSAGFDAHSRDPLGGLQIEAEDFGALTRDILHLAMQTPAGGLISLLEGGYDLHGLQASISAHLQGLEQKIETGM